MLGLRIGKVIATHYERNTIDVFMENGGGIMYNVPVVNAFAGTSVGVQELPILNTVAKRGSRVILADSDSTPTDNLYHLQTLSPTKTDLDDPSHNYSYAVIGMVDEQYGKVQPICVGFIFPELNQMLFNPDSPPQQASAVVQSAVKKLKGAFLHRTSSDVYWTVDSDGNMEWAHPNGTFFRIAEHPTVAEDGVIHVDLSKANNKATDSDGNSTNAAWNTSLKKGSDGNLNSSRQLYCHLEVVTAKGTVLLDIDKQTGNVTIKTPVDVSGASADNNQLTIIAGGNATIESVQGDVKVQSVNGNVSVEASRNVTVQTDSASRNSIILASNAGSQDNLVFLHKLISKFNNHQHICNHTGAKSSSPLVTFDDSDGTSVTTAG